MTDQAKEAFHLFIEKKKRFKSELEQLLLRLKNNEEEQKNFVHFSNHTDTSCINESNAKHLVLDLLEELDFPSKLREYTDLYYKSLQDSGYMMHEGCDNWQDLVSDYNGFIGIGVADGDYFCIDFNEENPTVKVADPGSHYSRSELIEAIYSEVYDFYFDKKTNEFYNKNHLPIDKIFDEDGDFDSGSKYVQKYLSEDLDKMKYSYQTFVDYIILKTEVHYTQIFQGVAD